MDDSARALAIALLCVLAVSLAAATLSQTQSAAGDGPGSGLGSQPGTGSAEPGDGTGGVDRTTTTPRPENGGSMPLAGICVPFLTTPAFFALATAAVAGVALVARRHADVEFVLSGLGVVVVLALPVWLVLTDCRSSVSATGGARFPSLPTGGAGQPTGGGEAGSAAAEVLSPPVLLGLALGVAAVLALLVYRASGGEDAAEDSGKDADDEEAGEPVDEEPLAAVGAAAGEAADRIEGSGAVENEVYRAWREMTGHVDVGDPATSTPGEFATAARDAGMAVEHVETLTGLFRDVRYGGVAATADREERAVSALRAIEDRYAAG